MPASSSSNNAGARRPYDPSQVRVRGPAAAHAPTAHGQLRTFSLFLLATATVACSATPGNNGYFGDSIQPAQDASADAAVAADTASGADATSGGDTSAPSDLGAGDLSSSGPDSGLPPDAIADVPFVADVPSASDAQSGGSDSKGGADAIADVIPGFDAGTPDVAAPDVSFGDAASDPKCTALCQLIQAANCPAEESYDSCTSGCSMGMAVKPECATLFYAMVDCSLTQTLTCGANGKSAAPPACKAEVDAVQQCFGGGSGGCTGPSTCSADSSGNCGCTGCDGQYGMECVGETCTCLANGVPSQTFSSAGVCQNPGAVMDAMCKPAP